MIDDIECWWEIVEGNDLVPIRIVQCFPDGARIPHPCTSLKEAHEKLYKLALHYDNDGRKLALG